MYNFHQADDDDYLVLAPGIVSFQLILIRSICSATWNRPTSQVLSKFEQY